MILFMTGQRIGDVVSSTAVLEGLKVAYPQARFCVATSQATAELFIGDPRVQKIITVTERPRVQQWIEVWKQVYFYNYELIVDLRGSLLSYSLVSKRRLIGTLHPKDHIPQGQEATPHDQFTYFRHFLGKIGAEPKLPQIYVNAATQHGIQEHFGFDPQEKVVAIGPIASQAGKEWSQDYFQKLLSRATGPGGIWEGYRLAFLCSDAARPRIERLEKAFADQALNIPRHTSILKIAALLRRACFYIGNDSGLLPLATACGTPALGLFGPKTRDAACPLGPHGHWVRAPECTHKVRQNQEKIIQEGVPEDADNSMASLTVDTVYDAVSTIYAAQEL